MKCLYLLLLLALNSTIVAAQEPDVVRINTDLVQTAVTVLDKKGNFVDGLQREQFDLVVDDYEGASCCICCFCRRFGGWIN